ncbi:MAG: [LysW]-lysine hydrolase [Anaerolineae bacterium]
MTHVDNRTADALLTGLVEHYSPSTEEHAAVAYLVNQMDHLGLEAEIDAVGNAVGTLGEGDRTILLLGHIDTVPGFIEVRQEGRQLYGRGTVDAKGPLAAFVAAAARAGSRTQKRIVVVGAVEEEAATSKGARWLLERLSPDAVVIGEPSGWDRITVGYKGRLLVDYTLHREIGHTAGPDDGVCDEAFTFWSKVRDYARVHNEGVPRLFDQLSPSLRTMRSERDGFTGSAALTLGFRLPPNIEIDELEAQLCEMAGEATLRFRGREPAYHASKATPLARSLIKAIYAEGGQARFTVKSGTSDMNVVGPVWRCPILAYGPGDSTLDHTPHEHIDLDEYHRAIAVLTRALVEI